MMWLPKATLSAHDLSSPKSESGSQVGTGMVSMSRVPEEDDDAFLFTAPVTMPYLAKYPALRQEPGERAATPLDDDDFLFVRGAGSHVAPAGTRSRLEEPEAEDGAKLLKATADRLWNWEAADDDLEFVTPLTVTDDYLL